MENNQIQDIHTHSHTGNPNAIVNYQLPVVSSDCDDPGNDAGGGNPGDDVFKPLQGVYYSAGIHPWDLTECNAKKQLVVLQELLGQSCFVAIGEAGMDKLANAPMRLQIYAFEAQVRLSEQYRLPLIIHCVKAVDELLAVRKKYNPIQPWIWHSFRGKPEQAKQLLDKGFYLSFREVYSAEAMRMVPDNRLFLETDDTGLAIEAVLRKAADVREVSLSALRRVISENVQAVFLSGKSCFFR
ncbi:TatD family hydrolase [Bacteroides reticulotermitis]|uniref:TatD family hydrolase n=1 Tax=Bacteroides reticulotermitis TaxID=1133319 RepID=UPI003A88BEE0